MLIIQPNQEQTAEVEYAGKHPDIFSTYLASELVRRLAHASFEHGALDAFRADLNVQSLAEPHDPGRVTPLIVNIGGQLIIPDAVSLRDIARQTVEDRLEASGYFRHGDFSREEITISLDGITSQSPNLNGTTQTNSWADSCNVQGHYIANPFGLQGTFPSLILAKDVDKILDRLGKEEFLNLRSDGKVELTITYTSNGFDVTNIDVAIAHEGERVDKQAVAAQIRTALQEKYRHDPEVGSASPRYQSLVTTSLEVNPGGVFNVYFLQGDSGASKAKDSVIITGGLYGLGTDAVWGKCLYKSSSLALPYAFALSRVVCDVVLEEFPDFKGQVVSSHPHFASVTVKPAYGRESSRVQLVDIDPRFQLVPGLVGRINTALKQLPSDRASIGALLSLGVNPESYDIFNDPRGFHEPTKPWKTRNEKLTAAFREAYTR